ncbi:MAG: nitroreductase family protein, partial [Candidatus Diapherotrites archaeon]
RLVKETKSTPLLTKCDKAILVLYQKNYLTYYQSDIMSAAAAIQNLLLAAHEKGVAALWVGTGLTDEKKIREILHIPENYWIASYVLLGYADEAPNAPKRRPLDEIRCEDAFSFGSEKCLPGNYSPKNWSFAQLKYYWNASILHTSPKIPGVYPAGNPKDFKKEIDEIAGMFDVNEGIEILPYAGTHTVAFLGKKSFRTFSFFDISTQVEKFLGRRLEFFKIRQKTEFLVSDSLKIPAKDNSFEGAVCFQKLEGLPEQAGVLKETGRILKKGGLFVVSFRNYFGWYGLWYIYKYKIRKAMDWQIFEPIGYFRMKKMLEESGFEITGATGIAPTPLSRGVSSGFFAPLCKVVVFRCVKK